ncbi:MAG: hypothetical protein N2319_01865 [Candidatus Kapabacteria bacterium]|nr:hypothetical protein [Candidatus Kapabacteria bacterium]
MKSTIISLFLVFSLVFFASCDEINNIFNSKEDPNQLGGSGNIPMAQVGNTFDVVPIIGNKVIDLNEKIKIIKNENGVVTMDVECDVPNIPELKTYIDRIPSSMISNGRIKTQLKFKITNEGLQDYFNKDGKPHTIVKYNAKVGDEYKLTKSDGKTITRKVIARSDVDDFPYGLFYIKTITTEQDSRIAGIKKFVFRTNHKFGLVHVEAHMDDGSIVKSYVYTGNY